MKKLILALAAMLITAPAVADQKEPYPWYYDYPTQDVEQSCIVLLRYTAPLPPGEMEDFGTALANSHGGTQCGRAVSIWLEDTGRVESKLDDAGHYTATDEDHAVARALNRCGAQIILRYNDDTPIADALAAEFDTACGEPPAIM